MDEGIASVGRQQLARWFGGTERDLSKLSDAGRHLKRGGRVRNAVAQHVQ